MGLTTANFHIHCPGDENSALAETAAALRQLLGGMDYEETDGGPARVFILAPHPPWISVYDSETGLTDTAVKALSKTLRRSLVTISVEDSDRYAARLCREGRWIDRISLSLVNGKGSGKPDLWTSVLTAGGAADAALARQGGVVFAEDALRHLCRALALPGQAPLLLPEEVAEQPPPGALVLRFRSRQPQAPEGPPQLALVSAGSGAAPVGQDLPQLFVAVANDGPTASGLRVRFAGPPLRDRLIEPVELHVTAIIAVGGGIMGDRKSYPLLQDHDGCTADLPALQMKHRVNPKALPPGAGMVKALKEYSRAPLYFHLAARALQPGSGDLSVRIEWLDSAGPPLEVNLPVSITPPA